MSNETSDSVLFIINNDNTYSAQDKTLWLSSVLLSIFCAILASLVLYILYRSVKGKPYFGRQAKMLLFLFTALYLTTIAGLLTFALVGPKFIKWILPGSLHNSVEVILILIIISGGGKFRGWHAGAGIIYLIFMSAIYLITLRSLPSLVLLVSIPGSLLDLALANCFILIAVKNYKGSMNQRKSSMVLAFSFSLHLLGAFSVIILDSLLSSSIFSMASGIYLLGISIALILLFGYDSSPDDDSGKDTELQPINHLEPNAYLNMDIPRKWWMITFAINAVIVIVVFAAAFWGRYGGSPSNIDLF